MILYVQIVNICVYVHIHTYIYIQIAPCLLPVELDCEYFVQIFVAQTQTLALAHVRANGLLLSWLSSHVDLHMSLLVKRHLQPPPN